MSASHAVGKLPELPQACACQVGRHLQAWGYHVGHISTSHRPERRQIVLRVHATHPDGSDAELWFKHPDDAPGPDAESIRQALADAMPAAERSAP